MLGNLDSNELLKARKLIEDLKTDKLAFTAQKHIGDPLDLFDVLAHFNKEVDELLSAIRSQPLLVDAEQKILSELADVSGMVDVLALLALRKLPAKAP